MPSFDVEVKADAVELRNAVDQAQKEIGTRYDFRGTKASVEQKDLELYLGRRKRLPAPSGPRRAHRQACQARHRRALP